MEKDSNLKIWDLASHFRQMIMKCGPNELPQVPAFPNFPRGTCGDVSMLLGKYLIEQGYTEVQYVFGVIGQQTHGWLELNEIIIDITADQFPEIVEPVIVTRDRSFHDRFRSQRKSSADFGECDDYFARRLRAAYNIILSNEINIEEEAPTQ